MYATASRAERMSGSETISSSGVPARFRSMPLARPSPSCSDLPASSSRWARVTPIDLARAVLEQDLDVAVLDDRLLVLADLVALRQVRIEVILAREDRAARHAGADGEPEHDCHAHGFAVQHRQHAGVAEVHEVRLDVRRRAVGGRRAGEDLRARRELRVDLEADDGFPFHGGAHANAGGMRRCQSVARCQACAAASSRSSAKCGPMICSPTGRPSTRPQGTDTAGSPARLAPIV